MRLLKEICNFKRNYLTLIRVSSIRVIIFLPLFFISTCVYSETNNSSDEYILNHATNLSGYREAKSVEANGGSVILIDKVILINDDEAKKPSSTTKTTPKKD